MRIAFLLVGWLTSACLVEAGELTVSYEQQIRPLLQQRCVSCHGVLKQEGGLRLDTGAAIRNGGDTGAAVVAHGPDESLLLQRITSLDPAERMPPEGSRLTADEVAWLETWVAEGASSPADEQEPDDPRHHWAFQPPHRPRVPDADPIESRHPVDQFLAQKRAELGLVPMPEADRPKLLRRVYLDLIGLPPTRQQVDAFVGDTSPDAYERVVDELLQNPAYGERWGRHWMDVWRYSDWYGRRAVPDVMNSYPHIWRWRDWIVRSLNEDKPYDQMVREMLAADELYPGNDDKVVATGFLVRNWFKWNYENWMKDNVEHTAKAFLGITLQCAHCHDHKFDPIRQREYFAFRAFFEPLELRQDRVPGAPDPGPFKKYVYAEAYGPTAAGLIRVFDEKLDAPTYMYVKGDSRNRMTTEPPVEPGVPAAIGGPALVLEEVRLAPEAFYPGLRGFIREEERTKAMAAQRAARARLDELLKSNAPCSSGPSQAESSPAPSVLAPNTAADGDAWKVAAAEVAVADKRVESLERRIAADDARFRGTGDAPLAAQAAAQSERELAVCQAKVEWLSTENHLALLVRDATQMPSEATQAARSKAEQEVTAAKQKLQTVLAEAASAEATYSPLSPIYPDRSTGRRAALARWITSAENPLTARVAVNHMWLRHFGRGLVTTPGNLGRSGASPSHPELLDWLATELIHQGWRMKPMHRRLVTSRAYRMQSHYDPRQATQAQRDPDNRWYWRANVRRMEAEVVRDSILLVGGDLDRTFGGPELDASEGMARNRRSLYFSSHGEGKMLWLELFDAADVCDAYQRTESVRPQQALALTNGPLTRRISQTFVHRWQQTFIEQGRELSDLALIDHAFRSLLSRPPTASEQQYCVDFLRRQVARLAVVVPSGETKPMNQATVDQARASLVHALFSHNDFVTVR